MPRRIIIATVGSLGDLHPFIAIAHALRKFGFSPVFGVSAMHLDKVHAAGFEAHDVAGDYIEIMEKMGLSEAEIVQRIMGNVDFIFSKILLPTLEDSVHKLNTIIKGADAVLASPLSFAASISAEKYNIPLIAGILQPSLFTSAYDPIVSPQSFLFVHNPDKNISIGWNKSLIKAINVAARTRYGREINRVRRIHNLSPSITAPFLDQEKLHLALGMYSPVFGPAQKDYPAQTHITGFPVFDSQTGTTDELDDEFESFLNTGNSPLVFTLGSLAVYADTQFYQNSLEVAQSLNQRAILLTGKPGDHKTTDDLIIREYAPHSLVFPKCSAIIHHGGVGTIGQALMAGKPQLVVPHLGDQWDNGARIKKLGVGDTLQIKSYNVKSAARKISALLNNDTLRDKASSIGDIVRTETGATHAADIITKSLS